MATGGYTESFGYILYLELNRHSVIVINFFLDLLNIHMKIKLLSSFSIFLD